MIHENDLFFRRKKSCEPIDIKVKVFHNAMLIKT